MKQSMVTKRLPTIVQISDLDQMLAEMNQMIKQRDSKIASLKQTISEKKQSAIGYRDFFILKNNQDELRNLCQKIDLQWVKVNDLLQYVRDTKSIFSDLHFIEAEVNEQRKKIQELSNTFFIQEETEK